MMESMYYDNIKNQWCLNHDISLIRIPYCYRDSIDVDFIASLINRCRKEKQVFLPVDPVTDDHRMPLTMKMLATVINAVVEKKREGNS